VRDQVELYESSGGTKGTTLRDTGLPVVVVTNLGARSGKVRKTPVMRVEHDGRYLMVASKGGAPENPVWYYNLRANPLVELQDGPVRQDMIARELSGEERAEWWKRAVEVFPNYAEYKQEAAPRVAPRGGFVVVHAYLGLAVYRADAGQDGLDAHVHGSGVRAHGQVERGDRGVVLTRRVDAEHDGRAHGVAPGRRAHLSVAVLQYRVRGRAWGERDGAGGHLGGPARGTAELMPAASDRGDSGEAVQGTRAPAHVGEVQRVVDGSGRAVRLSERDPDAELTRLTRGNGGRGEAGGVGGKRRA
jgi:deazaflavin-dependent oxidoreductase (nitroreductase family)